jgi:hypothetical protein
MLNFSLFVVLPPWPIRFSTVAKFALCLTTFPLGFLLINSSKKSVSVAFGIPELSEEDNVSQS